MPERTLFGELLSALTKEALYAEWTIQTSWEVGAYLSEIKAANIHIERYGSWQGLCKALRKASSGKVILSAKSAYRKALAYEIWVKKYNYNPTDFTGKAATLSCSAFGRLAEADLCSSKKKANAIFLLIQRKIPIHEIIETFNPIKAFSAKQQTMYSIRAVEHLLQERKDLLLKTLNDWIGSFPLSTTKQITKFKKEIEKNW